MTNVVEFKREPLKRYTEDGVPIIIKIVDGKEIECVDLDGMTKWQFDRYMARGEKQSPPAQDE